MGVISYIFMNTFPIPDYVINELVRTGFQKNILNPEQVFEIGRVSSRTMNLIMAKSPKVFISKMALKHIIDRRGSEKIIYLIPGILSNPTKIVDNSVKRPSSFIFAKMNGEYHGVVLEITN